MIKIGIELPDEKINGVDFSKPELGNPGVGGSEYLFSLLASELSKKNCDITIFHYNHNIVCANSNNFIVQDSISMIKEAQDKRIDILIHQVGKTNEWYRNLEQTKIKTIAWAHVYLEYNELVELRKCNNVKRVVFVGKEEYDSYIDDDIITKSTYIYNMIPVVKEPYIRTTGVPIVTYVGSLVPAKGFHKLAEIWPKVLEKIPDGQLYVIGNGKVYNRDASLGEYGISQADYEQKFMKYLVDNNGKILPSVHFLGIVGSDKDKIFRKTTVGVVNPTALTETFCMSAVEMEYSYIPIVTKKKWGLLDTVKHKKTGYLFNTKNEFCKYLVKLLADETVNKQFGQNAHEFVESMFSVDVVIPKWLELLNEVNDSKPVQYLGVQSNFTNDFKLLKIFSRVIRFNFKLYAIPSFYDVKYSLKKIVRK